MIACSRKRDQDMTRRFVYILLMLLLLIGLTVSNRSNHKVIATSGAEMVALHTQEVFNIKQHEGSLQIRYLHLEADQKSGDAIFIRSPDGKNMLIDAGMVDTGKQLDRYLDQLSVEKIDYAIATHPHHDHIGGYHTVLQSREVGQMLMPNLPHRTEVYSTFLKKMADENIEPTYVKDGDRFKLGKDVEVEIISPSEGAIEKGRKGKKLATSDINDLSVVLKVSYQNHSFLFTSDIYKKQEKKLVHLKKDVLDVDV